MTHDTIAIAKATREQALLHQLALHHAPIKSMPNDRSTAIYATQRRCARLAQEADRLVAEQVV